MEKIIEIKDITKHYQMGDTTIRALNGVSFDIYKNEYVAIMGQSGSGKSTLMNIIGCLDTPTSGSYILNNSEVAQMTDNELAEVRNKEIGFVFQTFNLLPRLSAWENVAMPLIYSGIGRTKRRDMALAMLDAVGLGDRSYHRPNELSGGQRQRIAIARALVNSPSIILADEPTGNLDTRTSTEIMEILDKIHQQGNTVIMVTHEEDIARYTHRIIKLRDGKLESDVVNKH